MMFLLAQVTPALPGLDWGHLILTGLMGVVVFFLQRELSRNDALRVEVLKLVEGCNFKLDVHEQRINKHGTDHKLLEQRLRFAERKLGIDLKDQT